MNPIYRSQVPTEHLLCNESLDEPLSSKNFSLTLYNAITSRSFDLARSLLTRYNPTWGIENRSDKNPIIAAVKSADRDLISVFVEVFKEAFFFYRDTRGQTALEHLYAQNDSPFIFELLERFSSCKDDVATLILLQKAIERHDLAMINWLCDYGVNINCQSATFKPLIDAINSKSAEILSLFLNRQIKLWDIDRPYAHCLETAVQAKNIYFIRHFLAISSSLPYNYSQEVKSALKSDNEIFSLIISMNLKHEFKFNENEIKNILECLLQIKGVTPRKCILFLYRFVVNTFKKRNDWNLIKEQIFYFYSQLNDKFDEYKLKWITEQLFEKLFLTFNPLLAELPGNLILIADDLKHISKDQLKRYFIALHTYDHQIYGDFSILSRSLNYHSKEIPSKNVFLSLSSEEQIGWIEFGAIFRSRKLMNLNIATIQTSQDSKLLQLALRGLRAVGIAKLNKSGLLTISRKLEDFFSSNDDSLKSEAIKTFWSLDRNPHDATKRNLLISLLKDSSNGPLVVQSLINTLSNYNHATDFTFVEVLLNLYENTKNSELHESIAIALSKIPHPRGLLKALEIVRSSVWDHYDRFDRCHHDLIKGETFILYHRPKERYLNRSAMIERILDQRVNMSYDDPNFQKLIDERLKEFLLNPDHYPSIKLFSEQYNQEDFRAMGAPLFLPPDTSVVRVLGAANGSEQLYLKAFIDFLLKGSGSCDLSGEEIKVKEANWTKNGASFTTTDPSLYEKNNWYFTKKDSMIILVSAEEYNRQALLGQGRMEKEMTIDPIFLEGFSTSVVEKLYIHERYKNDLELLMNIKQLGKEQVFSTTIFKELSLKECVQIRRHLEQISEIKGNKTSFFERIAYYNNKADLSKEQLEKTYKFASEDEIYAYSLRRLIARQIVEI